ncbi:MAG TPA: hypothetical protein VHA05_00065 [Candidatus Saccharimonadales bacterium]|nr:hypothetical protein [Candidatus Saccharimonadales bacterium]
MRDLEATRQAEDALFKKAAREVHDQGATWFSLLDVAAQIAIENKKLRSRLSLGDRMLQLFGINRSGAEPAVTIDDGLYAVAGRLQCDGSLEARRAVEGPGATNLYRLAEKPEAVAAVA